MLLLLVTQKAILGMCTDLTDLGGPLLKSLYLLHQASKKQFKPQKKKPENSPHMSADGQPDSRARSKFCI